MVRRSPERQRRIRPRVPVSMARERRPYRLDRRSSGVRDVGRLTRELALRQQAIRPSMDLAWLQALPSGRRDRQFGYVRAQAKRMCRLYGAVATGVRTVPSRSHDDHRGQMSTFGIGQRRLICISVAAYSEPSCSLSSSSGLYGEFEARSGALSDKQFGHRTVEQRTRTFRSGDIGADLVKLCREAS